MSSKLKKIYGLVVIVALAVLVGCGGGGGGSTTTPPVTVTQTVTCPDGASKTGTGTTASAALDAATAQCAAPTLVSITPADKATGVSPDTTATNGIVIATSSTLATPALSDITLKAGTIAVPVTVTMTSGNKGFKFIPSTKLSYAQAYTYIIGVTDALGKKLSIGGGFTTSSVSCVAPLVPDSAGTSCVPPTCPTGTVWNGSICTTTVLHYTEKVYSLYTGGYPFYVHRNTDGSFDVSKVSNMTPFTAGFYPLANCWLAKTPLADGKVLVSCQDAISLSRHVLYIDPVKEEMYEYTGLIPPALQYITNSDRSVTLPAAYDWIWGHSFDQQNPPAWAENVTISTGTYYTTYIQTWILLFKSIQTGVVSTVKNGDPLAKDGGSFTLLISYSN